jgi:hypothetical protein
MMQLSPRSAGDDDNYEDGDALAELNSYELRHLAEHLADARRADDIHRLLALEWTQLPTVESVPERSATGLMRLLRRYGHRSDKPPEPKQPVVRNAWHEAKERIGDLEGYVADIDRADGLAAADAARVLEHQAGEDGASILAGRDLGLEIRYALARASVNSIASRLPPQILGQLALRGGWSFEQAWAYARRNPSPQGRAESLTALIPVAPPGDKEHLAEEALGVLGEIIEDAQPYGKNPGEHGRRVVLERLGPLLSQQQLLEALALVDRFGNDDERVAAQEMLLLPLARCGSVDDALARCLAFDNEVIRARSLDQIADFLDEAQLDAALEATAGVQEEHLRYGLLAVVAPRLAAYGRGEWAIGQVRDLAKLPVPGALIAALRAFPEGVDPGVLTAALDLARAIDGADNRARVLVGMLARSAKGRADVLDAAIKSIAGTDWDYRKSLLLCELAPLLKDEQVRRAAAVAARIRDLTDRVRALTALGQGRPEAIKDDLRAMFTFKGSPRGPKEITKGVIILGPQHELAALDWSKFSDGLLGEVAGDLPSGLLPSVAAAVRASQDGRGQEEAISQIAAEHLRMNVRSLDDLRGVGDEALRGELLGRLAPQIPDEEVDRALAMAIALEDDPDAKAAALGPLVPRLTVDQLERVVDGGHLGSRGVAGLVLRCLPDNLLDKALTMVEQYDQDAAKGWGLASLIPYLDRGRLERAVADARRLGEDGLYQRDAAFAAATGRFAELGDAESALSIAGKISQPIFVADAISRGAASMPSHHEELRALARPLGGANRVRSLLSLAMHGMDTEERQTLVDEALDAVHEADTLVAAAELLPADRLGAVLDRLPAISWEGTRVSALAAAAPRLEGVLLEQAITIARAMAHKEFAFRAMIALIPQADGSERDLLLWQALEAATQESFDNIRTKLLATLCAALGRMDPIPAHQAYRAVLSAMSRQKRSAVLDMIGRFAPLLASLTGSVGLDAAMAAIRDAARWWP